MTPCRAVSFSLLASATLVGCGSGDDAKEAAALARLRNRPAPAYVRFVNLAADPLTVKLGNRPLYGAISSGKYSQLTPIGTGKQTLSVGVQSLTVDAPPGKSMSAIVYPGRRSEVRWGDERAPTTAGNVQVVLATGDSSCGIPGAGIAVDGPTKRSIRKAGELFSLDLGDYRVAGEPVKIEAGCAYTFLFVPYKKRLETFLMKNTMNERPLAGGMSKA